MVKEDLQPSQGSIIKDDFKNSLGNKSSLAKESIGNEDQSGSRESSR
jgi:hypothetical protein